MTATGLYLFKKNGYYYIGFTDEAGRRRQMTTKCARKSDALRKLSDFKRFIAESERAGHHTISSFEKEFLPYARTNFRKHTAYLYEKTLGHFRRIFGDLLLEKVTAKHFDLYKVTRLNECVRARLGVDELERKLSPITVNVELRTLRAAMSAAVRWKMLDANPFSHLALISVPVTTPAFLRVEDAVRLLDAVEEDWLRDFIIFALNTGMRRGEMLSLRWRDIDYEHRLARITNREDFTAKAGLERMVSLNATAMKVIERQPHSSYHEFVFSSKEGMRLTADHATKMFKKAAMRAGLSKGFHLHSTRHSFASWLVGQGTSLYAVSKLLGHTSTKASEIYSHLLPQHLQDEVEKIKIGFGTKSLIT